MPGLFFMADVIYFLAVLKLSSIVFPLASSAVITAEKVHPVPWVSFVSMRGEDSVTSPSFVTSYSTASPSRCPPFIVTLLMPSSSRKILAAFLTSCSSLIFMSAIFSASCMFGVTFAASGRSVSLKNSIDSSSIRTSPLVAIITGSMTYWISCFIPVAAMTSIISTVAIIPLFMACGTSSLKMLCSWLSRNSAGILYTSCTPIVFWAVREVTAAIPYTPPERTALLSARTPAPPVGPFPTTVNSIGNVRSHTRPRPSFFDYSHIKEPQLMFCTLHDFFPECCHFSILHHFVSQHHMSPFHKIKTRFQEQETGSGK